MKRLHRQKVLAALIAAGALVAAGAADTRQARFLERGPFVPPADAPDFVPDEVIVKWNGALDPAEVDALVAPMGGRLLRRGQDDAFDLLSIPGGRVSEWVAWLSGLEIVDYAEPNHVAWICSTPNDTYFQPYQWNFLDWGQLSNGYASNYGVQGQTAWNTTSGAGVTVAVVDTGVAYENNGAFAQAPDLAGCTFVSPWDFVNNDAHPNDDNSHGTHVAGTVCQTTNNASGCAGLAYSCSIMPVKVLDAAGSGTYANIADGIRWAADHGAFAINLSLSGGSGSSTLQSAVDYAWNKGCVICAAAGNSGAGSIGYPARYTNCIAVGATKFDGKRCSYSQFGTGLDVMAPGGDTGYDQNHDGYGDGILQQTFSGGYANWGYYFFSGTSMATPHVAAIAALVKANKPAYSNAQARAAIENTCKDLDRSGYDTKTGYGLVSAKDAIQY